MRTAVVAVLLCVAVALVLARADARKLRVRRGNAPALPKSIGLPPSRPKSPGLAPSPPKSQDADVDDTNDRAPPKLIQDFLKTFQTKQADALKLVETRAKNLLKDEPAVPPSPVMEEDALGWFAEQSVLTIAVGDVTSGIGSPLAYAECKAANMKKVAAGSVASTDTQWQSMHGTYNNKKYLVFTFRGTSSMVDLGRDLQFFKVPQTKLKGVPAAGATVPETEDCSSECGKLHSGFMGDYMSVRLAALKTIQDNADYDFVLVTGHSLGAAVAHVMAFDLAYNAVVPKEKLRHIVFGLPRVGDSKFAAKMAELLPNGLNYVTRMPKQGPDAVVIDPVAQVPTKILGFADAYPRRILFAPEGKYLIHMLPQYAGALQRYPDVFGVTTCQK